MKRKIKISKSARISVFKRRVKYVPNLRLSGVWLQAFGFEAGQMVNIECINNQIVISHG